MLIKKILNTEIQEFINNNLNIEISKLLFKGSPFKGISIQELANQILAKKKSLKKLPTWFGCEMIYYPPKISIEQASSEKTAKYKASLLSGKSIIDISGGFGVDAYYFSKVFKNVTHCELNITLSEIVNHNNKALKVNNIKTLAVDGIQYISNTSDFFDCIYVDPSRRNDSKGKVFMLRDCEPNLPKHLDLLFVKTNTIMVKNSPMLDISIALKELKYVKEIYVIALDNEVKELLFLLEKGHESETTIKTVNILKNNTQNFNFVHGTKTTISLSHAEKYLYEPNAAIMKSGGYNHQAEELKLSKLNSNSHLFTSSEFIDFPGRTFEVIDTIPYDKKQIKKKITDSKANITIRNFPKSVAQIRKETKLKDGGDDYLFFTKDLNNKNIVIFCKKTKQ